MKIVSTLKLALTIAILVAFTSICFAGSNELSWRVEYDDQGRIARNINPSGQAINYSYTSGADGTIQSITATSSEGPPVTWRFDSDGHLTNMVDGTGEVSYRYDGYGRLISVARKGSHTIRYCYDDEGRLSELQVGDFYRIVRTYDFLGRIAAVQTPAGRITYEYLTGQGTIIRKLPNGVRTIWKRGPNGRLEEITHGFSEKQDSNQYAILSQYKYSYGPDGRTSAIQEVSKESNFNRRYEYDTMGRLIRAFGPGKRAYGYTYDLVGNRVKAMVPSRPDQVLGYDWAGRLTIVNGKQCTHDGDGNLINISIDGVPRQFQYYHDGRLAKATTGSDIVQYHYDGFGYLIARKTDAKDIFFTPDQMTPFWKPFVIEDSGGARTMVIWDGPAPLALVSDGNVEWLLHDRLGSVRLSTDGTGNVTQRHDYDPFGVSETMEQAAAPMPGFAGLFWDDMIGGYITMARTFVPKLGTFLQPDPHKRFPNGLQKGLSFYTYCDGDPVGFIDRDGAEPVRVDAQKVWWDAFWGDVGGHLFDSRRAKDTLADFSSSHLKNARGWGCAASLTATALDLIGGYIPGEGGQ